MATNLLCSRWSSQGVNLWTVDLQTVPLVAGQKSYTIPANTIAMLDAYVTITYGGETTNRYILPISRSEYASYPNPDQQGTVTVYWFDRLLSPTVTLYLTPDGTQGTLNYYRMRQIQDVGLTNSQQVEIPYYFLEAFVHGLALRLAMRWASDKVMMLKAAADESYSIAVDQNVETANFYVSPQTTGYFRV